MISGRDDLRLVWRGQDGSITFAAFQRRGLKRGVGLLLGQYAGPKKWGSIRFESIFKTCFAKEAIQQGERS
jgi:hypothetical protein